MNPSDLGSGGTPLSAVSKSFAQLRDVVMAEWVSRVVKMIPAAAKLGRPILTNTLPVFYDDIAQALSPGYPRETATATNNLGAAHGRERASLTDYTLSNVVQELQIFRNVIFEVSRYASLEFELSEMEIIHQSIDDEIRESITAFNKTHEDEAQMLIARLSHDLRNPLHIANAAIQLLRLRTDEKEAVTLTNLAVTKIGEVDAMIQTILDTASVSKHKKAELSMDSFDMKTLAEETCADLELVGRQCKVTGIIVSGFWNRASMKRLLENLLSNAQKYGASDTEITVDVSAAQGRLLLAVHNEGEPIPSEELPRLFTAFARGEKRTDVTGWGLGLAYVQHVAESHNGTVLVDSALGRGTTFTVSVPIDSRPLSLTR